MKSSSATNFFIHTVPRFFYVASLGLQRKPFFQYQDYGLWGSFGALRGNQWQGYLHSTSTFIIIGSESNSLSFQGRRLTDFVSIWWFSRRMAPCVLLCDELITLFGTKATCQCTSTRRPTPSLHQSIQGAPNHQASNNGRVNNDVDVLPDNRTIGPVHY